MRAWILLVLFGPPLVAQPSTAPYDPFNGPSFEVRSVNYTFPQTYKSIRDVDFQNLTIPVLDDKGVAAASVKLTNGKYESKNESGREWIELDDVYNLNQRAALVVVSWTSVGGSSSNEGEGWLFVVFNGRLHMVQELSWDEHFQPIEPDYYSFDKAANTLTIRSAHYLPGDAHCCVSAVDVVTYRWDGKRFAQTNLKTELSDYGKSEGKSLGK